MTKELSFLRVNKTTIVDEGGRPVVLKGVCLGGWLMMEGYMLLGRNIPERVFKAEFEKALGKDALADLTRSFRDTFITEDDIAAIAAMGANCVRIPFNYRLIEYENRPFSLNEEGLFYLDRAVDWCTDHGLYCILDLHAAPGGQNPDWHADCAGKAEFFSDDFNQDRYLRLWHFLADRYKESSTVAGYDVLNEPVVGLAQDGIVRNLYERVTREIRDVDQKHIIFLEGTNWAQNLIPFGTPADTNTAYSIHVYVPADFTCNWTVGLRYPGKVYKISWNKKVLDTLARQYRNFIEKHQVPLYIGEFGVNWRDGHYGELEWVKDILYIFSKNGFHWTYWTYKTVPNIVFPDGIFRYLGNPAWVNRKGPLTGWETWSALWPKERSGMIASWRTENFTRNDELYLLLKDNF